MESSGSIRGQISYCESQTSDYDKLIRKQHDRIAELDDTQKKYDTKSLELDDKLTSRSRAISRVGDLASRSVSAKKYAEHMDGIYYSERQNIISSLDDMLNAISTERKNAEDELKRLKDERTNLQNQLTKLYADLDAALRREEAERQAAAAAAAAQNKSKGR